VKRAFLFLFAFSLVAGMIVIPMAVSADTTSGPDLDVAAQTDPTLTPTDPNWLGFAAARDALSEDLNTRIQLVQRYRWAQVEFIQGIAEGCTSDFPEGVEPPVHYFGWRYVITLLNGRSYEVRVSFDLKDVLICDEVTVDLENVGGDDTTAGPIGNVAEGPLEIGAQVPNTLGAAAVGYLNQGQMDWVKIQAKDGQDWCGFISNAHGQGFKVLASTLGDPTQVTSASYHESFGNYLADLAACGADAIEVHNEPNIEREWPAGQINGASYTELLKVVYPKIKAANSSTIVITGAPAPTGFFGAAGCTNNGCNDDVFYQQMAAAGAAQFADCIGVHYNEGVVSPKNVSGDPRDNYPTRYFQTNLNRALSPFPGMVACITEIGYLSPEGYGPLPAAFAWGQDTSVAEQAQWLAEAAVLSSQLGNVRLMIIFNLNFTLYGADPQAGYAMVRADDTCPACDALASVQQ
jgi:hypothetical protein